MHHRWQVYIPLCANTYLSYFLSLLIPDRPMKKNLPPRERCQRWLMIHCLPWLIASSAYAQTATPITWQSAANAPTSRYEAEGIAVGSKLYALGGFTDNTNKATKRCDAYDPATDTWTQLADMPEAVTHSGTAVDGN